MGRHGGGQQGSGLEAGGVGRVGYLSGMVVGIVALLAIFWLPFKHPKACAVAVLYAMLLGAFMWLIGSTDTLENSSSVMWIPTFAGAVWIYRRYMAPKPPKK